MICFYDFPYRDANFSDDEWDRIPRGHKAVIRDYYLNKGDRESTCLYGFWDTTFQVRKVELVYKLEERPKMQLNLQQFDFES